MNFLFITCYTRAVSEQYVLRKNKSVSCVLYIDYVFQLSLRNEFVFSLISKFS